MNYFNTVQKIIEVAGAHPAVNLCYEGDVFKINDNTPTHYPVVVITPNPPHDIDNDVNVFRFTVYCIDRLTADMHNRLQIQSDAIDILRSIFDKLADAEDLSFNYPVSAQVFTQRFTDECAGAFIQVDFETDGEGDCVDY